MASPPIQYEAAPDVQVILKLIKRGEVVEELEANINVSKTTLELKQSLSKPLQMGVEYIDIYKGSVQLQDNVSLMDYEISTDETLIIMDKTP
ncbi:hypothetical protein BsWGS_16823 [Bradybaena similaris]